MKDQLINEATKYGLAILVLTVVCIALSYAVSILWKELNKRDKDVRDLQKGTMEAMNRLEHTVGILIQKL